MPPSRAPPPRARPTSRTSSFRRLLSKAGAEVDLEALAFVLARLLQRDAVVDLEGRAQERQRDLHADAGPHREAPAAGAQLAPVGLEHALVDEDEPAQERLALAEPRI